MITANMKYVVFTGYEGEQIIIFPKVIQHSVMANDVERSSFGGMRPIAGGFIIDGQCVGESESLRMKSRGDVDTALIPSLLGLDSDEKLEAAQEHVEGARKEVSRNKAKRLRKKTKR